MMIEAKVYQENGEAQITLFDDFEEEFAALFLSKAARMGYPVEMNGRKYTPSNSIVVGSSK